MQAHLHITDPEIVELSVVKVQQNNRRPLVKCKTLNREFELKIVISKHM